MNNIQGIVADIETTLFAYGFAWIESNDKKDILFYYGVGTDEHGTFNLFDRSVISSDTDVLEEYDWAEFGEVIKFTGYSSIEEWNMTLSLPQKIHDLLQYYGYLNIFGEHYGVTFKYNTNLNRFQRS